MRIDENWAIDPARVAAFFAGLPGVRTEDGGFVLDGCRVTLESVPGTLMGKWEILRTRICIDGSEDAVKGVYQKFFLRFLSAGG